MKSGLTYREVLWESVKVIRLVVLQPCPGGRAALLCLEQSEAAQGHPGISMAVVSTALHDNTLSFTSAQKLASLPLSLCFHQSSWRCPSAKPCWGSGVIQGFLRGQEGCRQVWSLLLNYRGGSRALCHSPEKQMRSWPYQEVKRWAAPQAERVAEGAGLDPGSAPALRAWWLGSHQPRQRRWLLNSCCNCALGGKNLSGSLQGEA